MPASFASYLLHADTVLTPSGERWAAVSHTNPLESDFPADERLIAWSGWYGDAPRARAGVFPRDFRTWTPAAWKILRQRLERWASSAPPHHALILRTHARHLLSDAQACSLLLREVPDERIHILLDPAAMLEPAMLGDAEDHCARILQLAHWPRVAGVVVTGAALVDDELHPDIEGEALPRDRVEAYVNRFAPAAARFFPG